MYSKKSLLSLFLCVLGVSVFLGFDDIISIDKEYVDDAITTKNRVTRSIIYMIFQNQLGYWVIRCIPLIIGISFGKSFLDAFRKDNKRGQKS